MQTEVMGVKFICTTITTNEEANDMVHTLYAEHPTIAAFDTETTGLHIILDKPFIFQFGYLSNDFTHGYTYAIDIARQPDLAKQTISVWHDYVRKNVIKYLAHNVKFDLHMLANIGLTYAESNLSDTMFYIRYAHDAIPVRFGGVPLGLKEYAAQYIDRHAKQHEQLLMLEKSHLTKTYNTMLCNRLKKCGTPPAQYNAKSYTQGVVNEIFKDCIATKDSLPTVETRQAYEQWLNEDLPRWLAVKVNGLVESDMIRYDVLNREHLLTYAHYDIIYVLLIYLKLKDTVTARGNDIGIKMEEDVILPLWEMERVGFKVNVPYLRDCKTKVEQYIKQQREKLYTLAEERDFTVAQHAKIKEILFKKFNQTVQSTGDDELTLLVDNLKVTDKDNPIIEFIEIIQELRTLQKWYSTYIIRFLKDLNNCNRLYTMINQVGTASGRVTSDFQQFPKEGIKTKDGEELFKPRRMVEVSNDEGYNAIVYLDYSQIELRFQAFYTILVGTPDKNLCRAYMPYECYRLSDTNEHIPFDFKNPEHIKHWNDKDAEGKSVWLHNEDDTPWVPTDVHGATTKAAFGIDETHPDYKHLRYVGKRVNFAKNYGAQRGKIRVMFPDRTEEEIDRIDAAYYTAFPGVKNYHTYCYERAQNYSYTENLFGIRYYGTTGHKLINMLVQGSAAFYLKWKIKQVYDYCKANNVKSRFQMNIHDELSFERYTGEDTVFFDFKNIMETWEDSYVPIVADMEVTTTTWAEKVEVETLSELRLHLSN